MELQLKNIKQDARINSFIDHTDKYLRALGYTDHGRRHLTIVRPNTTPLLGGYVIFTMLHKSK